MNVIVVKLGGGNTASVLFALERLGARATLSDDPRVIAEAERVVLPGVGAAGAAMRAIEARGLREVLSSFPRALLGVCLGQQLLYAESEEGEARGLGRLSGSVRRLPASTRSPIPHMGWSRLALTHEHPLTEGVGEGAYVYFVHSYVCPLGPETIATATHGCAFPAIVARGAVMGCQFHPERSGAVGARILANFLRLPC